MPSVIVLGTKFIGDATSIIGYVKASSNSKEDASYFIERSC